MSLNLGDILKEVIEEAENKQLLNEYYSVANIGGKYKIIARDEKKDEFPCHFHLYDGKSEKHVDTINLEISVPDYKIVNVKVPKNGERKWDYYRNAKKYLFNFLSNRDNERMLVKMIIKFNQTNKHLPKVIEYAIRDLEMKLEDFENI